MVWDNIFMVQNIFIGRGVYRDSVLQAASTSQLKTTYSNSFSPVCIVFLLVSCDACAVTYLNRSLRDPHCLKTLLYDVVFREICISMDLDTDSVGLYYCYFFFNGD